MPGPAVAVGQDSDHCHRAQKTAGPLEAATHAGRGLRRCSDCLGGVDPYGRPGGWKILLVLLKAGGGVVVIVLLLFLLLLVSAGVLALGEMDPPFVPRGTRMPCGSGGKHCPGRRRARSPCLAMYPQTREGPCFRLGSHRPGASRPVHCPVSPYTGACSTSHKTIYAHRGLCPFATADGPPTLAGWANYFRHGVAKHVFGSIDSYALQRVWRWLKKKHGRMKIRDMKRSICINGWQFAMATTRFTGASTVTVTRYRYRGKNIPNPWNQQPLNPCIITG